MREQGFYSIHWDDQGGYELHYAANQVTFPSGLVLLADEHEQHTYPIEGWSWFDDEQQALDSFGVK